jgi:hypothetical protein
MGSSSSFGAERKPAGKVFRSGPLGEAVDDIYADVDDGFESLETKTELGYAITDPGDAGAIAVTRTGTCPLVTAGAETRTLADPTFVGQVINLCFKTDGGDAVVTSANGVNQTGNNTLTFADAGDVISLVAIEVGANYRWRVAHNDGVGLTTV